ncbi:conserved hypothetical protein [Leishmania major strain Friedlin]|uniref:Uncharacterized protein n=1 Tax=Leishmania major TaxID=5664 RepID=E9AFE2_LEIMA|nr:conserved hypothetical protein [Leishmania major strain Friedlin]CAG9582673.1 hypothetical_protein_-_conserved [Leishmania major strain Friedlin]CBZ12946.1 conserved hypothetical protein [Leishmania major strain Friedlin]|eukprot:XP_003722712.1 conserved hypothetical protein [Leishmania major strain Friedlin]
MRTPVVGAGVAPLEPAPLEASSAAGEDGGEAGVGDEGTDRERFSKMWMYCLQQMQGHEVGMLMDMMPPDIQELYSDKLSDEYLLDEHDNMDKGVHALRAAQKMVEELTSEQLFHIEEFLAGTDAFNAEANRCHGKAHHPRGDGDNLEEEEEAGGDDDEDLFMHRDEGMGSDEEEWLLEQMIAAGDKTSAAAK